MKKVERKKANAIGAGFGLEQCFSSLFFNYFLKSETSSFGLKACLCVAKSQILCLLLDRIADSSTCEEGGMVTRHEPFALLLPQSLKHLCHQGCSAGSALLQVLPSA